MQKKVVEMGQYEFDIIDYKEVMIFSMAFHWSSYGMITQDIMEDYVNKYYPEWYDVWFDKFERELRVKSYKAE